MNPPGATKNILESTAENIIESERNMGHLIVATFDDLPEYRVCVPDTGYLQGTDDPNYNMFIFNLNRSAFAAFNVVNLSKQTLVKIPPRMMGQVRSYDMKFSA